VERTLPARGGEGGRTYSEIVRFDYQEIISLVEVSSGWYQLGSHPRIGSGLNSSCPEIGNLPGRARDKKSTFLEVLSGIGVAHQELVADKLAAEVGQEGRGD
jgi:hypothetical protein